MKIHYIDQRWNLTHSTLCGLISAQRHPDARDMTRPMSMMDTVHNNGMVNCKTCQKLLKKYKIPLSPLRGKPVI